MLESFKIGTYYSAKAFASRGKADLHMQATCI